MKLKGKISPSSFKKPEREQSARLGFLKRNLLKKIL